MTDVMPIYPLDIVDRDVSQNKSGGNTTPHTNPGDVTSPQTSPGPATTAQLHSSKEVDEVSNNPGTDVDDIRQITFLVDNVSEGGSSVSSSESDGGRENWSGRLDFLLCCVGYAVGIGNIWRFPYLCFKSGGGAFLIPYFFFMLTCAIPLFFLEISLGQFASLSPISIWRISPLFKGVGYGMVIISGLVCIYYNVIICWTFYFLFESFKTNLPWAQCGQSWNTDKCVVDRPSVEDLENGTTYAAASDEYWRHNVLELTSGIDDLGTVRWPLFGCLFLAWLFVFLCLCKGVKSSGKVVYVTALFPYVVLVILLFRGLSLPGALSGIQFYLVPKWTMLQEFKVWGDAATQIFFSVGPAWGGLITMSSYNKFNHNVYRDAVMVPIINCGTSIFAGLVIFSVMGFMSYTTGLPIEQVASQGPGLAFVVYPEALAKMPLAHLWSVLFFIMLFFLGLDSQFGQFETMTSAFIDEYPALLRKRKVSFTAFMCSLEFFMGIIFVYQGGMYVLQIMDWYAAVFTLMILSICECTIISWIYGVDRFKKDIQLMTGSKPTAFWGIMWSFVTPLIVLFTWLFSVIRLEPVTYGTYIYPDWAIMLGWMMGLMSVIPLPVCAITAIRREKTGTLKQKIKKLMQHASTWGPSLTTDRIKYVESMNQYELERYEAARRHVDRQRYLEMPSRKKNENASCAYIGPMEVHPLDLLEAEERLLFPQIGARRAPRTSEMPTEVGQGSNSFSFSGDTSPLDSIC